MYVGPSADICVIAERERGGPAQQAVAGGRGGGRARVQAGGGRGAAGAGAEPRPGGGGGDPCSLAARDTHRSRLNNL